MSFLDLLLFLCFFLGLDPLWSYMLISLFYFLPLDYIVLEKLVLIV